MDRTTNDKGILRAIAVDDEKHCLETLSWELTRNCPEVIITEAISDEHVAKSVIPNADIDILFMDIHLQSISGIELVKSLQPLDCQVIFVTAYDQYAIQAFEVAAVHYLLKPINATKLRAAIDRVIEKKQETEKLTIDRILKALGKANAQQNRIPFNVHDGIEFVIIDEIIYVAGENNYSVLHLTSGKSIIVSKTLSTVEKMINTDTFLRIHKSYLLNLNHIVRYVKADGGYIEVKGGDQLSVSRAKRNTINELFR